MDFSDCLQHKKLKYTLTTLLAESLLSSIEVNIFFLKILIEILAPGILALSHLIKIEHLSVDFGPIN